MKVSRRSIAVLRTLPWRLSGTEKVMPPPEFGLSPYGPTHESDQPFTAPLLQYPQMASKALLRRRIFCRGKRRFVVCRQVGNFVRTSNATIANLDAVNSLCPMCQVHCNFRTSTHWLRIRRAKLDIIGAKCHQVMAYSSDFELNPA